LEAESAPPNCEHDVRQCFPQPNFNGFVSMLPITLALIKSIEEVIWLNVLNKLDRAPLQQVSLRFWVYPVKSQGADALGRHLIRVPLNDKHMSSGPIITLCIAQQEAGPLACAHILIQLTKDSRLGLCGCQFAPEESECFRLPVLLCFVTVVSSCNVCSRYSWCGKADHIDGVERPLNGFRRSSLPKRG
jgi:hypothetical protein